MIVCMGLCVPAVSSIVKESTEPLVKKIIFSAIKSFLFL